MLFSQRFLFSGLCLYGKEAILKCLRAVTGKEITPGIIAVIQSFGSKIKCFSQFDIVYLEDE